MNLLNSAQHAIININSAKMRSFLALLGIWIGSAAVVALLNFGQIATQKALEQFKTLGTDLLAISLFQNSQDKQHIKAPVSLETWRELPEQVGNIKEIAPYTLTYQPIIFGGHSLKGAVIGADESLAKIINIQLQEGHFVSFVDTFEHFCVVGTRLAQQIKEITKSSVLGKQLQIGHIIYTIIGIAKPWKENVFFNEEIDQAVIIPIAGTSLLNKDATISNAILKLNSKTQLQLTIKKIEQFFSEHAAHLGIFIRSAQQIIESMEKQGRIFTLMLAVIGSISLLVGGIGVMNVMLISVSERRKEIGIRKAIGAKNSEIQRLFLIESTVLSIIGGFLGVITGLLVTLIIAFAMDWSFSIYWLGVVVGFLVSLIVGITSGYYPAYRAAHVDAVISLRGE